MTAVLVDTNVISEILKPHSDSNVVAWSQATPIESLFMSVVSLGELQKGLTILPVSARRTRLEEAIQELVPTWFADRILPVSAAAAERWGVLAGQRQMAGRPLGMADGLIAATALEHDLTVATRNVRDFDGLSVKLLNPWKPTSNHT